MKGILVQTNIFRDNWVGESVSFCLHIYTEKGGKETILSWLGHIVRSRIITM